MADWQVTATTIFCEYVDDEVTLLIYGDGASKCTGQAKYAQPDKETAKMMEKKSKQSGKALSCPGIDCLRLSEYRKKWLGS
jgi:hypothetical protein